MLKVQPCLDPPFEDDASLDLLNAWEEDVDLMLEDLTHDELKHVLWLAIKDKPCKYVIGAYAVDVVERQRLDSPSDE